MNAHQLSHIEWDKPHLLFSAADFEAGVAVESPDWNHLSLPSFRKNCKASV